MLLHIGRWGDDDPLYGGKGTVLNFKAMQEFKIDLFNMTQQTDPNVCHSYLKILIYFDTAPYLPVLLFRCNSPWAELAPLTQKLGSS